MQRKEMEEAARALGLQLKPAAVRAPEDFEAAFKAVSSADEAHLAEIYADAPVAAQVTSDGFAWPHTLPQVHEDLDYRLGFLSSKVLAQKRK
jgi:hypothetical protein